MHQKIRNQTFLKRLVPNRFIKYVPIRLVKKNRLLNTPGDKTDLFNSPGDKTDLLNTPGGKTDLLNTLGGKTDLFKVILHFQTRNVLLRLS